MVMDCPKCQTQLRVRWTDAVGSVQMRVRICPTCGTRYRTEEKIYDVIIPKHTIPIDTLFQGETCAA